MMVGAGADVLNVSYRGDSGCDGWWLAAFGRGKEIQAEIGTKQSDRSRG
jgi:hypothetical protein